MGVGHRFHAVVGQHQGAQARVHHAQLPHLGPVLQLVVSDLQQAQRRAGRVRFRDVAEAVEAEEELIQPGR